jgi:AraC family transcriptional activator of pobA
MTIAAPVRAPPGAPPIDVRRLDAAAARRHSGPHVHDHYVLVLVESGRGSHTLGAQTFDALPGHLFVLAPGEVHDAAGLADAFGWVVSFDESAVDASVVDGAPVPPADRWPVPGDPKWLAVTRQACTMGGRFSVPRDRLTRWSERLRQLESELTERPTGWKQAARALLSLVLIDTARVAMPRLGDRPPVDPVVAEVFDVIDRRYAERLTLDEVARAVGRSPGHLTRIVKETTGDTVVHWIERRKMVEARRLLLETGAKVEAIAAQLGFADPSHFRRRFRHVHGVPPATWREINR